VYLLSVTGSCSAGRLLVRLAVAAFTVCLLSIGHRHILHRLCSRPGRCCSGRQLLLCGQCIPHHSCLLQLRLQVLLLLLLLTARLCCVDGAWAVVWWLRADRTTCSAMLAAAPLGDLTAGGAALASGARRAAALPLPIMQHMCS
jgi:hypothetical protein